MTDETVAASTGWFADLDPGDTDAVDEAIRRGDTDEPEDWPRLAVEAGYANSESEYYDRLHEATIRATRQDVRERERADDQQLIHAVRAMDDCERTANELAERATEWAGALFDDVGTGIDGAREVAGLETETAAQRRAASLCEHVDALATERDELERFIEETAPAVAPNLSAMAEPVLAARLIALAGGLDSLAKKPSGTIQVLGAEDALFAHLSGRAPSPKHGIIFTHDYVRNTRKADRGSAARAVAGKLAIAARIDHYAGDFRPDLHEELRERMATIRGRAAAEGGEVDD